MPHDDLAKLSTRPPAQVKKPLTDPQAFGAVILVLLGTAAAGFGVIVFVGWLAWSDHTFGPRDLRYLMFVRGTLIERVGAIDAEPGTLIYRGRGRDGNAPGFVRARHLSQLDGDVVLVRLADRCKALGLLATMSEQRSSDGGRFMSCGREAEDEFGLGISVSATKPTEVWMAQDIED